MTLFATAVLNSAYTGFGEHRERGGRLEEPQDRRRGVVEVLRNQLEHPLNVGGLDVPAGDELALLAAADSAWVLDIDIRLGRP